MPRQPYITVDTRDLHEAFYHLGVSLGEFSEYRMKYKKKPLTDMERFILKIAECINIYDIQQDFDYEDFKFAVEEFSHRIVDAVGKVCPINIYTTNDYRNHVYVDNNYRLYSSRWEAHFSKFNVCIHYSYHNGVLHLWKLT